MAEIKKEKVKPKPKYYSIEVEAMIPAILKYKILASSPEEAIQGIFKSSPVSQPRLILSGMKRLGAKVFDFGTKMIKFSKRF